MRRIVQTVVLFLLGSGVAQADQWRFYIQYAREGQNPTAVYAPPEHLLGLPPTISVALTTGDAALFPIEPVDSRERFLEIVDREAGAVELLQAGDAKLDGLHPEGHETLKPGEVGHDGIEDVEARAGARHCDLSRSKKGVPTTGVEGAAISRICIRPAS